MGWTVQGSNPVGPRFSAPVPTSHEAHPAYYAMGTGIFPGIVQLRHGINHPSPSSAEVKKRVELYPYSTSEPSRKVMG